MGLSSQIAEREDSVLCSDVRGIEKFWIKLQSIPFIVNGSVQQKVFTQVFI
jgi:hypothetical protein